jgi:hypothetical protein
MGALVEKTLHYTGRCTRGRRYGCPRRKMRLDAGNMHRNILTRP